MPPGSCTDRSRSPRGGGRRVPESVPEGAGGESPRVRAPVPPAAVPEGAGDEHCALCGRGPSSGTALESLGTLELLQSWTRLQRRVAIELARRERANSQALLAAQQTDRLMEELLSEEAP